ncbi:hypothetical protein PROFUN_11980 [Planoprotostelium fungivorum]|uniref:F-box domain-containing protein n=1 Tax=Planoprotostelium fungivorum TaxID=1890364 RepID=A0A2P6N8W7_9EUKA|nr:hypothetical protein PROFUN_11980 [Planoprotostelium fungivorum]
MVFGKGLHEWRNHPMYTARYGPLGMKSYFPGLGSAVIIFSSYLVIVFLMLSDYLPCCFGCSRSTHDEYRFSLCVLMQQSRSKTDTVSGLPGITITAAELWLNILVKLDISSFCRCQRVCKYFNELSQIDSYWEERCKERYTEESSWYPTREDAKEEMIHMPMQVITAWDEDGDAIFEENGTEPFRERVRQFTQKSSSWRSVFQRLRGFDTVGTFNYWVRIGLSTMSPMIRYKLDLHDREGGLIQPSKSSDRIVIGGGEAPWGPFELVGVRLGNWVSMLYQYFNSSLIVGLWEFTSESNCINTWVSDWQDTSGVSMLSKHNMHSVQAWSIMEPYYQQMPQQGQIRPPSLLTFPSDWRDTYRFQSRWKFTFTDLEPYVDCTEHRELIVDMSKGNRPLGAICGEVEALPEPYHMSKFLGTMRGGMLALGINMYGFSSQFEISMICQRPISLEDGKWKMEGYTVHRCMMSLPLLRCGTFQAVSL